MAPGTRSSSNVHIQPPVSVPQAHSDDISIIKEVPEVQASTAPIPEPHTPFDSPAPSHRQLSEHQPSASRQQTPFKHQTTANLAEAILLMTSELKRRQEPTRKPKSKEPDTFDGSDPKKLNNFILLCDLYFCGNSAYSDDSAKVTFALSYLQGTALEYFEPTLLDSDELPSWIDNYSAFICTLRTQFGPVNPTADAEDAIDHLRMQDSHCILKYCR